jgi:DNA-binding CsgD family transcriptional regulator
MARLTRADRTEFLAVKALCYRGLDSAQLRAVVGERLRRHVRADAFSFLALHPASGLPVHAVQDWPPGMCKVAAERALLNSPAGEFSRRALSSRRAYFLEQLVSQEDGPADPYVAEVLRPFGFQHEVQAVFASGGRAWGSLLLNRRSGREPFEGHTLYLLDAIAPHVTAGLRAAAARAALAPAPEAGLGLVLLGPQGCIEVANGAAERFLAHPTPPGRQSSWLAVQVVASLLARGLEEDGAGVVPTLTVVDAERGGSYRLRAERVRGRDGAPCGLILIEPVNRADRADALIELGLTQREAEVALAVLRGERTAVIAAALGVSPYTVQDHVRHICEKVGVSSRRELAALLLGTMSVSQGSEVPHPCTRPHVIDA